jgi:hypothetical protein
MEDNIWISFWEGMHRHAAITMSLLSANITHDSNNCYISKTLSMTSFCTSGIKCFANPNQKSADIIQQCSDGNRQDTPLLKMELTINAYIPATVTSSQRALCKAYLKLQTDRVL